MKKTQPDEVYNLAGQASVGLSFEQPVETLESIAVGTLNILEAIRFIGEPIKFYNAASSEVFGDINGAAADESTTSSTRSPYAVANYREAYGLFACSGILFNHDSPLRPERFQYGSVSAKSLILPSPPTPLPSLGEGNRSQRRRRGEGALTEPY